jgi:hypothetical protein
VNVDLATLEAPTDSESGDAIHNPDVWILRDRINILLAEVRENRDRLTRHHRYIEGLTGGPCRICAHEAAGP